MAVCYATVLSANDASDFSDTLHELTRSVMLKLLKFTPHQGFQGMSSSDISDILLKARGPLAAETFCEGGMWMTQSVIKESKMAESNGNQLSEINRIDQLVVRLYSFLSEI